MKKNPLARNNLSPKLNLSCDHFKGFINNCIHMALIPLFSIASACFDIKSNYEAPFKYFRSLFINQLQNSPLQKYNFRVGGPGAKIAKFCQKWLQFLK